MIPDLAPDRHRVAFNLTFAALMAIGSSADFYYGAAIVAVAAEWIPGAMEPWRKAMLLLATLAVPLLITGAVTLDPVRRVRPGTVATSGLPAFLRGRWRAIGLFVGVSGLLLVAVQALGPLAALALERRDHPDLGQLGHALGLVTLATTLGSFPVAGAIDRLLVRRHGIAARPLVMGAGAVLALPCILLLAFALSVDWTLVSVALFMAATCTSNALVPTMLQDLTPDALRARSFAVWSFVVSIFCAVGPLAAGVVSNRLLDGNLTHAIAAVASPALAGSPVYAVVAWRTVELAPRQP